MHDDVKLKRIENKLREELGSIITSVREDAIMKQVRTTLSNKDKAHLTKCRGKYGDDAVQTWMEGVLRNIMQMRKNANTIP